ncbi:MAG: fibrobacter succinogenes major paralogous domain-containing protein, partial [Bacteroidota bacterium]
TVYGKEIAFYTPDTTKYKGISIGSQVWMSKNLDVSRFRNGDQIPKVPGDNWQAVTTPAWKWINDDSVTYSGYGKLYNWYAVTDPRGLAPQGWHIPAMTEFDSLRAAVNSCGGCLKEIGTAHWLTPNTGANNITGFTALPNNGNLPSMFACFWSKDSYTTPTGVALRLYYDYNNLEVEYFPKYIGISVRCVQD